MRLYMETTKPKKEYVTPKIEVVRLDNQAMLLNESKCQYPQCLNVIIR